MERPTKYAPDLWESGEISNSFIHFGFILVYGLFSTPAHKQVIQPLGGCSGMWRGSLALIWQREEGFESLKIITSPVLQHQLPFLKSRLTQRAADGANCPQNSKVSRHAPPLTQTVGRLRKCIN